MQHDVTTFQYQSHAFRSGQDGENFYFVAKDVCQALALSDVSMACQNLPEDEKLIQTLFVSGQARKMLCVTESGLYRLIFRSNKPEAEKFRRWVFREVLPAIRKTGSYAVSSGLPADKIILDKDDYIDLLEFKVKVLGRKKIQPVSKSEREAFKADILAGVGVSEIARRYGRHRVTVQRHTVKERRKMAASGAGSQLAIFDWEAAS